MRAHDIECQVFSSRAAGSKIPGKAFAFLPILSLMPPVRSASDKTGVGQVLCLTYDLPKEFTANLRHNGVEYSGRS